MIVLFAPPIEILFEPDPPMIVLPPEPPGVPFGPPMVLFPAEPGFKDSIEVSTPLVKKAWPSDPTTASAPKEPSVIAFDPEPPKITLPPPVTMIALIAGLAVALTGSRLSAIWIWPDALNVTSPFPPMMVLFEPPIEILFEPDPPMIVLPPEPPGVPFGPLMVLFPASAGSMDLIVVNTPLVKSASPLAPTTASEPEEPSVIVLEPEPPMTTLLPPSSVIAF